MSASLNQNTSQYFGQKGSATAPSYSFAGDPNTGLYNAAADEIGASVGGVAVGKLTGNQWAGPTGSSSQPSLSFLADADTGFYSYGANSIGIAVGGGYAGRWTSDGRLFMGTSAGIASGAQRLSVTYTGGATEAGIVLQSQLAADTYPISFYNSGGVAAGSVFQSGATTTYNTLSDIRMKKDIRACADPRSMLKQISVVSHGWKDHEGEVAYGFVAQHLHVVAPFAVTPGRDNEDGSIAMPWGVDPSKLVAPLLKMVQVLIREVESLQDQVNAMASTAALPKRDE